MDSLIVRTVWTVLITTAEVVVTVLIGGFCWAALTVWP